MEYKANVTNDSDIKLPPNPYSVKMDDIISSVLPDQEILDTIIELLEYDELTPELFKKIIDHFQILFLSDCLNDVSIIARLFHFIPIWRESSNSIISLFYQMANKDINFFEEMIQKDGFLPDILQMTKTINQEALNFIAFLMSRSTVFYKFFEETEFFHILIDHTFHQNHFSAMLFIQNCSFLYEQHSLIANEEINQQIIDMIIENFSAFMESFSEWKSGSKQKQLKELTDSCSHRSFSNIQEKDQMIQQISSLTNTNFNDSCLSALISLIAIITVEFEDFLSFVETIVDATSPYFDTMNIEVLSKISMIVSLAFEKDIFIPNDSLIQLFVNRFKEADNEKIAMPFIHFFTTLIKHNGTDAFISLIENEIPQRITEFEEYSTTNNKIYLLLFFSVLLQIPIFELSRDVLENDFFGRLCDISLLAIDSIRLEFFSNIITLVEYLTTRNIWPSQTTLSNQLIESSIPEFLDEIEEPNETEEKLLDIIQSLKNL